MILQILFVILQANKRCKMDNNKSFSMIAEVDADFADVINEQAPEQLPILAVRNMVLFPGIVSPVLVGRPKSKRLIADAERNSALIGICCQRNPETDEPDYGDL